ncbi:MAG TPA: dihydroorotate dehydrogenase [Candidatus Cloacimonadota bacterium]|nr:dihydroorotate dehydrogenase [Candidatus Cloacimonadota bacterium]
MNRLETRLGKLSLANPVTVASGTFGTEYAQFFDLNRLGAYTSKTITPLPKKGNPTPRLFETEAGLLNSIGLQNPGVEEFIENHLPELRRMLKVPLIVSFSGSTLEEFCRVLRYLEECSGADAYEVNVSCPNVENEGIAFGVEAETVFHLTKALRKLTGKELIIKLSPNVTDIVAIAQAGKEGGADSLALINTMFGMAIDPLTGRSRIRKGIAGYSGLAIKPIALANTYKVASAVDIPILAMGGINTWQDALEFFYAGASAIALGTANFTNPNAVTDCLEGLDRYLLLKQHNLCDIIGNVSF